MDRINWVTSACFHTIASLSGDHEEPEPPARAHDRLQRALDEVVRRAGEAGYGEEDARLIVYALAALADEVAMAAGGALRAHWSTRPLQLHYFRENVAGERFFFHLTRLLDEPADVDVLRTYYLCLLFGFRGQFGVRGDDAGLRALIDDVRRALLSKMEVPERLMPRTVAERPTPRARTGSWSVRMAVFALLATMALYLGLSAKLAGERAHFVEVAAREESR